MNTAATIKCKVIIPQKSLGMSLYTLNFYLMSAEQLKKSRKQRVETRKEEKKRLFKLFRCKVFKILKGSQNPKSVRKRIYSAGTTLRSIFIFYPF